MVKDDKTSPLNELMKQETLQTVVHDLRVPITVLKGYLQLLMSGAVGEMQQEQLKLIERTVGPLEEMMMLTENLLQVAKLEEQKVHLIQAPIDLDCLLRETIDFYELPFSQRQLKIYREGNTVNMVLRIDGFWIRRILHNLIWNAYKFTPDGGKVTLSVTRNEKGLEVTVADTGRGITPGRLRTIFDKFEQDHASEDRKLGSGLGLWISKKIMELHGGRIRAESEEGKGSRFILFFPASLILPVPVGLPKRAA